MLKKDCQALRSIGIDIHKPRNSGLVIDNKQDEGVLLDLLVQYVGLVSTDDKTIAFLHQCIRRQRLQAISNFVVLQSSMRERKLVKIQYEPTGRHSEEVVTIGPLRFFKRQRFIRVLALVDSGISQFHLAKIRSAVKTTKRFAPPDVDKVDEMFRYSWDVWTGGEKHKIRVKLSDFWAERLSLNPVVADQNISRNEHGDAILEGTVNSLEEVARWVLATAGEVRPIEPAELVNQVRSYVDKLGQILAG